MKAKIISDLIGAFRAGSKNVKMLMMMLLIHESGGRPCAVTGVRMKQVITQDGQIFFNLTYSDSKTGVVPMYMGISPELAHLSNQYEQMMHPIGPDELVFGNTRTARQEYCYQDNTLESAVSCDYDRVEQSQIRVRVRHSSAMNRKRSTLYDSLLKYIRKWMALNEFTEYQTPYSLRRSQINMKRKANPHL